MKSNCETVYIGEVMNGKQAGNLLTDERNVPEKVINQKNGLKRIRKSRPDLLVHLLAP